ncbi:MAG TPA: glycosyl-4,4'-diaponeurosporenoate acyltransferase [Thermodesulfobacteriota bacterium]|nr:glycosyl-4,4'-diaponeurosporenoate acyltransferase [Thermodesulfobacteriota bacterium]HVP78680.1 glycosyl-4,4'-diaponeurosporenoate acyltransferase [Thermodesulfobacteriota bacterium]
MRLIFLPTIWTIAIDFIAWLIIHVGVVAIMIRIPARHFDPDHWLYRSRRWERKGNIYQDVFKLRRWKQHLPDGAQFVGRLGFQKKQLNNKSLEYFETFLIETCRAELTHWIFILFAPFFFLWNLPGVGLFMIFYALLENVPFIIAQRYNRYRFRRLLEQDKFKS